MIEIWPENGHVMVVALKEDNADTGRRQPASGLDPVVGFLADDPDEDATAIHADVSVELEEYPDTLGTYFGTINGTALTEHLPVGEYPDKTEIFQIVTYGSDLRVVAKAIVRRVRNG